MTDEMTDKIMQKLESVAKGVHDFQDEHKRLAEKVTTLDEEKLAKMSDDVAKTLEEVNQLKLAKEEIEKNQKSLEKIVAREDFASGDKGICSEEKKVYLEYLRLGAKPSKDVLEKTYDSILKATMLGCSNEALIAAKEEMLRKDLTVGNNPDGGYFIRPEIANFIIDRVYETSPMRQIATVATMAGESLEVAIDDGEADCEWAGEIDAYTDTATPEVGILTIHAHKIIARPKATQNMLDDVGFDIETWLQNKLVSAFSRKENTAFVVGNGSKKPRGFLNYPAWTTPGTYERGKLEQINSGTSGGFGGDVLIDLQGSLIEDYQTDATWVMKRTTWREVMKAKDGTGQYLLNPMMLFEGVKFMLLGKPVLFFEDMPAMGADALAIAYGNFKIGYKILDRIGIRVLRDPYTSPQYIKYITNKRVGADVTNYESIKILKLAV